MAAVASPRGRQWGEPRALGRAVKLLQRLEEQCRDPRLAMGPPSLRHLLPRTAQLLREVAKARCEAPGDPEGPGGAGDFLVIYLANLEAKGRKVAELLPPRGKKDANEEIFREGSRFRRQLAKLALIFSHMHSELNALFPGGKYCGHLYQLSKDSAHTFWRERCGVRCVLPWAEFQCLLCAYHPVEPGPTMQALRSTMDLTCNGHVSVFEFDIFTRLFQPWPTLLRNWQLLAVNHPGYMAFLTYDEVQTRLQACRDKPGSYIFRPSCTRLGQWAIGYVSSDGSILQTIPLNKPLFQVLLKGQRDGIYLYPDGKSRNPDLTELCEAEPYQRIVVSEEQLQLYEAMNSTFELCKICAQRDKDVRIQPCGHLLCNHCLTAWQQSDSQTCPFCRCQIKGFEAVSICQAQERSVEVTTTAEDSRDNCHQKTAQWELKPPVTPSGPPLPPEDPSPRRSQDKGWLTVVCTGSAKVEEAIRSPGIGWLRATLQVLGTESGSKSLDHLSSSHLYFKVLRTPALHWCTLGGQYRWATPTAPPSLSFNGGLWFLHILHYCDSHVSRGDTQTQVTGDGFRSCPSNRPASPAHHSTSYLGTFPLGFWPVIPVSQRPLQLSSSLWPTSLSPLLERTELFPCLGAAGQSVSPPSTSPPPLQEPFLFLHVCQFCKNRDVFLIRGRAHKA